MININDTISKWQLLSAAFQIHLSCTSLEMPTVLKMDSWFTSMMLDEIISCKQSQNIRNDYNNANENEQTNDINENIVKIQAYCW